MTSVYNALDQLDPSEVSEFACGGATGADALAIQWAMHRRVNFRVYYADWDGKGKSAGPIRNRQMLADFKPNLVIAFPGGAGTTDMIAVAKKAGVTVQRVGS
jgi:hypothetical protein